MNRKKGLDEEKPHIVIRMICRACKRCIRASYFLADGWLDGIDFIKDIRRIADGAFYFIGMTKKGNRKYEDGKIQAYGKGTDCPERAHFPSPLLRRAIAR